MRFLVVTVSREAAPPEMMPMMLGAMRQWMAQHQAKFEQIWGFAGLPGGGGIVSVDSLEELDEVMTGFPFAPFSNIQIYPLVDLDGALNRFEAVMQQMLQAMGG